MKRPEKLEDISESRLKRRRKFPKCDFKKAKDQMLGSQLFKAASEGNLSATYLARNPHEQMVFLNPSYTPI